MVLAAARSIVLETSHRAESGNLAESEVDALELLVSDAIAECAGQSPAEIRAVARNLYWKINPLGTVPPAYYADARFDALADRLMAIVNVQPAAPASVGRSAAPSAYHPFGLSAQNAASMQDLLGGGDGGRVALAEDVHEFLSPEPSVARSAEQTMESVSEILARFVGDLSAGLPAGGHLPEPGSEAFRYAATLAAKRLAGFYATTPLVDAGITSEFASIVPFDWAKDVVAAMLERIEAVATVYWNSQTSREDAVTVAAAKIARRLAVLADQDPPVDNFGNSVTSCDAQGWTRWAAEDVYQMLLEDDFAPYVRLLGVSTKQDGIAYLQKSIFENVYPAVIFSARSPEPAASVPAPPPSHVAESARREHWKMPWSVAAKIVDDLCARSGDEAAFLSMFKDWLGMPDARMEDVRNELVSEVLIRGREAEAVDEVELSGRPPVTFVYQNWRGEVAVRSAVPVRMVFGSNEWHKDRQWLMEAFDLERREMRTFAAIGIIKFMQ